MPNPVLVYAVHPNGAHLLETPAGATRVHEVFDGLPLGVYTGFRTFDRERILGLEAHLDRTERCMRLLTWEAPFDREAIRRAIHEVVQAYPVDAFVRLDVLPEPATQLGTDSRTILSLSQVHELAPDIFRDGVNVELARKLEREDPRIKTADFVIARRPYPLNVKERFEHLLLDADDHVLECTSSNFYIVKDQVVRTSEAGMLEGITRRYVLELCEELGLGVALGPVPLTDVRQADEAFLSSSTRGVVPVVSVTGDPIGTGSPGPHTRALHESYLSLVQREARPAWPPPGPGNSARP